MLQSENIGLAVILKRQFYVVKNTHQENSLYLDKTRKCRWFRQLKYTKPNANCKTKCIKSVTKSIFLGEK